VLQPPSVKAMPITNAIFMSLSLMRLTQS
jgi:hypothetical protein